MAVRKENIVIAALHTLAIDGIDMGGTFEPLVFSFGMDVEHVRNEISRVPIDSEITDRTFSAKVTLAEVRLTHLSIVLNLPVTNIVSSSSTLVLNSEERDTMRFTAVGQNGSIPRTYTQYSAGGVITVPPMIGTRTFDFARSRTIGTPEYNLAKLEATNIPVEFEFYADRTTGEVGTITDTESLFMLFDTARSFPIALDGASVKQTIYTAVNRLRLTLLRAVYDEASSFDAGVEIKVGKVGNSTFFSLYGTEASLTAGTIKTMPISNSLLDAGETMIVECPGGKTGAGTVTVQAEFEGWI